MKGFKGFDSEFRCYGTQYVENGVFVKDINSYENGIQFCDNPFDVLNIHGFIDTFGQFNTFSTVDVLGEIDENVDTHHTSKAKIGEMMFPKDFIETCINYALDNTSSNIIVNNKEKAIYTNEHIPIANTSNYTDIYAYGVNPRICNMGNSVSIYTKYNAIIGSIGHNTQIHTVDYSEIYSVGNNVTINNSGDSSRIYNEGNGAYILSTGNNTMIISRGEKAIIMAIGKDSIVKADIGSFISLSEYEYSSKLKTYIVKSVKTEFVDGKRIKADTFYMLIDGEFTEINFD